MLIDPKVPLYPKMSIHPNVHLSQSPHALNAHLSHIGLPICPKDPFALVLIFPGGHFPPSAHLPQNAHFLKCPFVSVLTCSFVLNTHLPKVLICPNCPMPIRSGVHLSWWLCPPMPICHQLGYQVLPQCPSVPKCPFASQCPFGLVLVFPGAHLPPMPICPQCPLSPMSIGSNVPICSTLPICLINAHLLWRSFFLVFIYLKCPFALNAHLPQCSSVPNAHLPQSAHFPKCPFVLVLTCFQRPFVPNRGSVEPIGQILLNFIFCPTGCTILNAF